jgi:hypothetical protein
MVCLQQSHVDRKLRQLTESFSLPAALQRPSVEQRADFAPSLTPGRSSTMPYPCLIIALTAI